MSEAELPPAPRAMQAAPRWPVPAPPRASSRFLSPVRQPVRQFARQLAGLLAHTLALFLAPLLALLVLAACEGASPIGTTPEFAAATTGPEQMAMMTPGMGHEFGAVTARSPRVASLWTGERGSLLGDNRAIRRGDILTVVISIDDRAAISNNTSRGRDGSQQMGVQALFGREGRVGVSLDPAVQLGSGSTFSGEGSVRRDEQLTLRVAATVIEVLPSGVLAISGRQEVRVNNELRELLVTGYVRPADISRQNEVSHDKIAAARISYGGRGQISDMQQPRWGQQVLDLALPF